MEAACVRQWSPHWLLPQGASTDTCLAWCSLSSQGQLKSSRRSRSTSINDWCQSGLTRPCHRPVSKNQSWSRILSPSSLTLAHPSALSHPLLFFSPCDYQSTSLCQDHCRQPVLSCLSHTYTHARGQTFSSPRTHTLARFFSLLLFVLFVIPYRSFFLSVCVWPSHTLHTATELPTMLAITLLLLTAGCKRGASAWGNHSARCVSATQQGGICFSSMSVVYPNHQRTNQEKNLLFLSCCCDYIHLSARSSTIFFFASTVESVPGPSS